MSKTFEKFSDFIERHAMLKGSPGVVVAVSGGPDSVALLDCFARLRDAQSNIADLKIHVAHLDHKLRGRESAEDAEFVRRLAERLELAVTIGAADVAAEAENARRGIEEIARELRYDFLLGVARKAGCDRIATGHTMSDQAETFLMRLARGAGLRGLSAMRPAGPAHEFYKAAQEAGETENGDEGNMQRPDCGLWPSVFLIRPLLCILREEVEEYCRERHLDFRIDSTNLSADYARNRARHSAIPALRSINSRAVESIARAARIIATDQDALDQLASAFLDEARIGIEDKNQICLAANTQEPDKQAGVYSVAALLAQPLGVRRRMIIEAINRARRAMSKSDSEQITSIHIRSVERLLEESMSGSRVELPGDLVIWREFDRLVFTYGTGLKRAVESMRYERELSIANPRVEAGGLVISLERDQPFRMLESLIEQAQRRKETHGQDWLIAALDDAALPERLRVRPRRAGERGLVLGQRKTKKLKNLMIDHKIPSSRRCFWPVVTTPDDRYIWSPGLPLAEEFAAHDETQRLAILRASTV